MSASQHQIPQPFVHRLSVILGVAVMTIGGAILTGWVFDVSWLRVRIPGQVTMKANTAFGFMLAGVLLLVAWAPPSILRAVLRWTLSTMLALLGSVTLLQYVTGAGFGIDELIARAPKSEILTVKPGRMAPTTATGFVLFAVAMMFDHWSNRAARGISRALATAIGLIGIASILGYAYGAPALYLGTNVFTATSLPAATLLLIVSIGFIWLRPEYGLPAMLMERSVVGTQTRSLIPIIVGPPLLVGAAVAAGYGKLYEGEFAVALTSLGSVIASSLVAAVSVVILRRSDAELQLKDRALDATRNGVFLLDNRSPSRPVTFVSRGFETATGYTAAEVIGRTSDFLVDDQINDAGARSAYRDILESATHGTIELETRRKDGTLFHNRMSLDPVANHRGDITHFVGIVDDVSDERDRENRVQAALDEANRANAMRNTFVRLVSHELRTPLNAALTWIKLMEIDDDPETRARGTEVVTQSIRSQSRLIDDLVDVTRFAAAGVRLEAEEADVGELVRTTVEELRPIIEPHQALRLDIGPGSFDATVDPLRVQQIVRNLLTNANKYTEPGGHVEVALRQDDATVTIVVGDTGKGLSPEQITRMFEPFWRAESHQPGLGVGLSIVAALVKAHKGTIKVHSDGPGKGSRFTVRLPRQLPAENPDAASSG